MNNYNSVDKENVWIRVEKKNKIKINNHHPPDIFEENQNKRKILCNNFLKGEQCQYGEKCLYAHSIAEQKMDYMRKKAYDIIQNEFDLSYLDLGTKSDEDSSELQKQLYILTKVCPDCINKKCAGGVNCKFGVYMPSLQICYEDMYSGKCTGKECKKVHLTKRGFNPINKNKKHEEYKKNKKRITNINIPKGIEITDDFFLSDNFKNLLVESDLNIDDISSVDSSLSGSIFD